MPVQREEERKCHSCYWHKKDRETGEWICTNPESEYVAEYTDGKDWCMDYEPRD